MSKPRSRTVMQRLVYAALRPIARLGCVLLFRIETRGRHHIPASGGVLVCSNHQSVMDPVLVGLACNRRLNYLARRSLFDNRYLGRLILFLDTIAIDRDGLGLDGLKETIRRLKAGEMVLMFPEGTRTIDGDLQPLKPGLCAIAKRAGASLLPVGIEGAYQSWPRDAKLPSLTRILLQFGPPITPEQASGLSAEALLVELESRMRLCHEQARAAMA